MDLIGEIGKYLSIEIFLKDEQICFWNNKRCTNMFREQNGEIGMHKDFVCFFALTVRKLNESLQNYSVMKTVHFLLKNPHQI